MQHRIRFMAAVVALAGCSPTSAGIGPGIAPLSVDSGATALVDVGCDLAGCPGVCHQVDGGPGSARCGPDCGEACALPCASGSCWLADGGSEAAFCTVANGGDGGATWSSSAACAPDPCHVGGTCQSDGTCAGASPRCGACERCGPTGACAPNPGAACDAGGCWKTAACQADASCAGAISACQACYACDAASGSCAPHAGDPCDDGDACTANDTCQGDGSCKGSQGAVVERYQNSVGGFDTFAYGAPGGFAAGWNDQGPLFRTLPGGSQSIDMYWDNVVTDRELSVGSPGGGYSNIGNIALGGSGQPAGSVPLYQYVCSGCGPRHFASLNGGGAGLPAGGYSSTPGIISYVCSP